VNEREGEDKSVLERKRTEKGSSGRVAHQEEMDGSSVSVHIQN